MLPLVLITPEETLLQPAMHRTLVPFEVPFCRISGLGAVAPPVPAECLRPYVVARNGAPKCEGDRRSGCNHDTGVHDCYCDARGLRGVCWCQHQLITRARAPSLSHRLHWMTGCRRPRLSACQIFSRSHSPMPTAHSLASAQSTAGCFFVWTTLSRVDPWRNQLTCSASRHATLVFHLHADRESAQSSWNSCPVALLVLLLVLISAAGERLTSSRSSPGTACLGSSPQRTMAHNLYSRRCRLRHGHFPCGERPRRAQRHCAVPVNKDTFCARLHVHVDPRPTLAQVFLENR